MRVALKLMMAILVLVVSLLAVEARLRSDREAEVYEADLRKGQHVLGSALSAATEVIWEGGRAEQAAEMLAAAAAAEQEINVRLVELGTTSSDVALRRLSPASLERLRRGEEVVQMPPERGTTTLYTYMPVTLDGRTAALELATSLRGEAEYVWASTLRFLAIAAGMMVAAAVASVWLGNRMVGRPVSALVEQARRVGSGDFGFRAGLRQRDELGDLGRALDAMAENLAEARRALEIETRARVSATEQLRHADRLAAVGTLAAGLAHELGTPLHVVTGRARLAHGRSNDEKVREHLAIVDGECVRMANIVRELLAFARRSSPTERTRHEVDALVQRGVTLVWPLLRTRGIEVEHVPGDPPARVSVAPERIEQVMTNLFINAAHAMPTGGVLRITWTRASHPPGDEGAKGRWVCIAVEDEGPGISPESLERIFDPFFTTKDVGEGVGLGLSVAHGIVRDHGGLLRARNRESGGARFELWLEEVE